MGRIDIKKWMAFLEQIGKDSRINVWHWALIAAIMRLAHMQKENKVIRVSRSKLMELSHIRTIPTYHKYFKELQDFGYITYAPSYHPDFRSTVTINNPLKV